MNLSLLNALAGGYIALIVLGGILILAGALLFIIVPMKTWLTALFSKAHVPMLKLSSLRFRKSKPMEITKFYILAKGNGLKLSFNDIESYYLSGGDCKEIISALSLAKTSSLDVSFDMVKALAFSGQQPTKVLDSAIKPKALDINNIKAITQDNIEMIVDVRATLRLNLNNAFGGLNEDTIYSRIQKQVITNIALSPNHKTILTQPSSIIMGLKNDNIFSDCMYSLASIEVARVDIGRDVGAEMIEKNAQKDLALAQVEAERVKNAAIVEAEQMKAKAEEMKSVVLEAEAEVPKAIAEAIKEGRFSVMDYYKLMNLQADTAMRRSIITRDDSTGE